MDYVPAVQVLEELAARATRELVVAPENVLSLDVLLYLEAKLQSGFEFYARCLAAAAQNGVLELIQPLLDRMLATKPAVRSGVWDAVRLAIVELLFPHLDSGDLDVMLTEAIEKDSARTVSFLIGREKRSLNQPLLLALSCGSHRCTRELLKRDQQLVNGID